VPETLTETSAEQVLKELFDSWDQDGSGLLNLRELIKTCRSNPQVAEFLGIPATIHNHENDGFSVIKDFFLLADGNGDLSLSWKEFRDFVLPQVSSTASWMASTPSSLSSPRAS